MVGDAALKAMVKEHHRARNLSYASGSAPLSCSGGASGRLWRTLSGHRACLEVGVSRAGGARLWVHAPDFTRM